MSRHNLHLPPEILTQILTKLPVKSLLRFRCVCKSWYSLISSPFFISNETLNHSNGDRMLLHRGDNENGPINLSFHDKSLVESHEHRHVPKLLRSKDVFIVGSCDGLICLCKDDPMPDNWPFDATTFVIWNPSIRKLVELPFRYSLYNAGVSYFLGFGFDSKNRDYKVVRFTYDKTTYGSSNEVVEAEYDVFDLKKGVWRSSSSPMRPCGFTQSSVYFNGNLHWVGYYDTSANESLLAFNLSGEVFEEMGMVPGVEEINDDDGPMASYTQVMPINGLLSAAMVKEKAQGDVHGDVHIRHSISVWSMKEYGVAESWSKLFNIELLCAMNFLTLLRVWENGEVLLVERVVKNQDESDVLVLYNPESRKSIALLSTNECIVGACFYKESLILL